jgi:hypothetical protein
VRQPSIGWWLKLGTEMLFYASPLTCSLMNVGQLCSAWYVTPGSKLMMATDIYVCYPCPANICHLLGLCLSWQGDPCAQPVCRVACACA